MTAQRPGASARPVPGRPDPGPGGAGGPGRSSGRDRHALLRVGGFSIRFDRRALVVGLVLAVVAVIAGIAGILIGDYGVGVGDVLASFAGRAADPLAQYFVLEVRLPRAVTALLVGAALGISGSIMQTVSGNPLGSPDIVGFMMGAATGALTQIILFNGGTVATAVGAIVGSLATAAVVIGLSWRSGATGIRLVLVGVGVGSMLGAVNALLIVKAPLEVAQTASQWLAGSLNSTLWPEAIMVAVAMVLLIPLLVRLSGPLAQLPLGDAVAVGVGVRPQRSRLALVIVSIALMAVATASTGPIPFVALAAPQLVRKLTRTSGVPLVGAALMGGVLVLVSDLIARRIFAPNELAVGVITGAIGGLYLVWLLIVERKRL
ncbi:MAG: FecCD family ABC transporter permease [Leucobacter sp.]